MSIIGDSVITCDAVIEETKTIPINFNEKNATCKIQNFYILLVSFLITVAFLKAVSIYCYLIKYKAKQKHLLPLFGTSSKLKSFVLMIYYKNGE